MLIKKVQEIKSAVSSLQTAFIYNQAIAIFIQDLEGMEGVEK